MVSTADHETGGLTLGRQIGAEYPAYWWHPEVVAAVQNSSDAVASMLMK